jgi:hypothetical protein
VLSSRDSAAMTVSGGREASAASSGAWKREEDMAKRKSDGKWNASHAGDCVVKIQIQSPPRSRGDETDQEERAGALRLPEAVPGSPADDAAGFAAANLHGSETWR